MFANEPEPGEAAAAGLAFEAAPGDYSRLRLTTLATMATRGAIYALNT